MICPKCHGRRMIPTGRSIRLGLRWFLGEPALAFMPCPECQGHGEVSCCDTAGAGIAEGGSPRSERPTETAGEDSIRPASPAGPHWPAESAFLSREIYKRTIRPPIKRITT
jgi:hypothetical protein